MLKYLEVLALRVLLRVTWLFPIKKKRVVLTSYNGRLWSCNPKYLALALANRGGYEVYFALKSTDATGIADGIRAVRYRSIKHIYLLMTAQVIIVNSTGFTMYLPYRKDQRLINTWHGVAYKVVGNSVPSDSYTKKLRRIAGRNTYALLSSCQFASDTIASDLCVDASRVVSFGYPRNDIFFYDNATINQRVRKLFGIPMDVLVVLYAPTYRDGNLHSIDEYAFEALDISRVSESLNQRFQKDIVVLFKAHHNMLAGIAGDSAIDVSNYPDIQELMVAADVLVTDYSSCMWDFALQMKAGFIYAPDLEKYESMHPFYIEPTRWPYPIARSNTELLALIESFEEGEVIERIEKHLAYCRSFEDGHACERVIELIGTDY